MAAALDHAVIMVRDRLEHVAPRFERDGYTLSELATHNVGSHNRLIVLSTAYLELLGWPPGEPPQRREIAHSPLGLEALVFRTDDAHATHSRLRDGGYPVEPVLSLSRPAVVDGEHAEARFETVRFAEQPVDGFRMYFCEHVTPELVWQARLMAHPNGVRTLAHIEARAPDPEAVAGTIADVASAGTRVMGGRAEVLLANATIQIVPADGEPVTRLTGVVLGTVAGGAVHVDLTAEALAQ